MQPIYDRSLSKFKARAENVKVYCNLTGLKSIPQNRGYWTLCNRQPPRSESSDSETGSEIVQLTEMGFLVKPQFFGVDRDDQIIAINRKWHPDAKWFTGDWLDVIKVQDFNPAMIYLDTTSFADHNTATKMVVQTMMLCPRQTVIFANVMLNDPRSSKRFRRDTLLRNLELQVPSLELNLWQREVKNYLYSSTRYTDMFTYIFYKE